MSNRQLNGYYGRDNELEFSRKYSYLPFEVTDIRTGKVLAKVHEAGHGAGLADTSTRYSVLGSKDEITYPLYTWQKLLDKLESLR